MAKTVCFILALAICLPGAARADSRGGWQAQGVITAVVAAGALVYGAMGISNQSGEQTRDGILLGLALGLYSSYCFNKAERDYGLLDIENRKLALRVPTFKLDPVQGTTQVALLGGRW